MIDRETIAATYTRITPFIRRTPVMDVQVSGIAEPVALKLEQLQHTGSFKARVPLPILSGAKCRMLASLRRRAATMVRQQHTRHAR